MPASSKRAWIPVAVIISATLVAAVLATVKVRNSMLREQQLINLSVHENCRINGDDLSTVICSFPANNGNYEQCHGAAECYRAELAYLSRECLKHEVPEKECFDVSRREVNDRWIEFLIRS